MNEFDNAFDSLPRGFSAAAIEEMARVEGGATSLADVAFKFAKAVSDGAQTAVNVLTAFIMYARNHYT